jgi:hypothetical protein
MMFLRIALVIAAAIQTTAVAQQCPDLSGTFLLLGEDGKVYYILHQHGCDSIDITSNVDYLGSRSAETHNLKLDGKDQTDSPWFGGNEQTRTTAKWVGSTLRITQKLPGGFTSTQTYRLNRDRNLVMDSIPPNKFGPSVAKRMKGTP